MSTMINDWGFYELLLGDVLGAREVSPVELFFAPPWEPEHASDLLIPIWSRRDIVPSVKVSPVAAGFHLRLRLPVTIFPIPEALLASSGWRADGGERTSAEGFPFVAFTKLVANAEVASDATCRAIAGLAKAPFPAAVFAVGDSTNRLREFLVWSVAQDEDSGGGVFYADYGSPVHHGSQ